MISKEKVKSIVSEIVEGHDLFLVHATVSMTNKISVFVDSANGITLDQCISIHRAFESKLDREVEDYELEVSSPGAAQPFLVIEQYHKNIGKEVEVLYTNGEKIKGTLLEVHSNEIILMPVIDKKKKVKTKEVKEENKKILFTDIKQTRAILKIK